MLTKEKLGAFAMFLFSIAYGYGATQIPLSYFARQESFNSKTMPFALSITGIIISVLIIVLPSVDPEGKDHFETAFKGKVWSTTIFLLILMALYGFVMPFLGFLISSFLFLVIGFYILGERRFLIMIISAALLVFVLWFFLSAILGMYMAPGELFYMLGVIK